MRSGMRIEETARSVDQIEQMIRQIIPADQLQGVIDNLGIPYSGYQLVVQHDRNDEPSGRRHPSCAQSKA